jgi:inward rectifier potassium channel
VVAVVTHRTSEGETFYKSKDLRLVRDRQVGMTRGWTVMHVIDETSPLYAIDNAAALKAAELEIYIALTGIDDVSMQAVHAMHQYLDGEVRCGERFVDTLTPTEDGLFVVDLRNFHVTVPDHTPRAAAGA